jgi:hypothetical protein
MKKTCLFAIINLFTTVAFADNGTTGISNAADGVVTYMPYVRALCYVIAAIIAVIGAMAVYYTMQTNPQNTAKRMTMTVGGALTFVCLSLALPQFFGIDGSTSGSGGSSTSSGTSSTGDGFLASDKGGISQSGIITDIPSIRDRGGNWITFPQGTNMAIANQLINIYVHLGSGSEGTYGRTLDYIHREYQSGNMDYNTFNQMMSAAGNLPHN